MCIIGIICTNPIFGKNLVPEILAKMFSANQIAGFLNQCFPQKKSMNFLHVDTNSQKLKVEWKFSGWAWLRMGLTSLVMGL